MTCNLWLGIRLLNQAWQDNITPGFRMPIHVMIHFENGSQVVNLEMGGAVMRRFRVPVQPVKITPDPWESVPAEKVEEVRADLTGPHGGGFFP